jgi:hypothetical protein
LELILFLKETDMIELIGTLAIVVIFAMVVWYLLQMPPLVKTILTIVAVVVGAIIAINFISHFTGAGRRMFGMIEPALLLIA